MNDMFTHEVRIIRPDEPEERAVIRLPEQSSARYYSALRDGLDPILGGPFEHVRVFADFDGGNDFSYCDLFVHECGRLLGMPRNETATAIYRSNVLVHQTPAPQPESLPFIAGPAILFRGKVWF